MLPPTRSVARLDVGWVEWHCWTNIVGDPENFPPFCSHPATLNLPKFPPHIICDTALSCVELHVSQRRRAGWLGDASACFQSVIILLCKALNLSPPQLASPQLTTLPVTSFTSSAFVSLLPTITKAIFMLYHQILAWPGPQEINEKFNLLLFSLASTIVLFVIINSARMTPPWGLPLTF